ncbi:hypothetical protein Tco_1073391 [Tanacetum coccineum]
MCVTTSVSILAIEEAESMIKLAMVLLGLLILVARDDVSVRTSVVVSLTSVLVLEVESLDSFFVMVGWQISFYKDVSSRVLDLFVVKVVWEVIETRLAVEAARRFTTSSSLSMLSANLAKDSSMVRGVDVGGI